MSLNQNKKYTQKFKPSWLLEDHFKKWLEADPDCERARCKYCKTSFIAHRKDLINHGKTKRHLGNMGATSSSSSIAKFVSPTISTERKVAELRIAAFIGEHCSMNAVDHLGVLVSSLDEKSKILKDIKLHRTKCSSLISNVLAPCWLKELIVDIDSSYFSLIIDESTSIDFKVLCLMIKYFSERSSKVVTTFFKLIQIENFDATSIFHYIKETLSNEGLSICKLIGIGVDGASVMVGSKNSLSTKLREIIPHLIINKCVCHSLHLAAENAFKVLPSCLDFLIRETYNWFAFSSKRQVAYQKLFREIEGEMPKKICRLSGTRWLARSGAIKTLISQWDALKVHFISIASNSSEKCYTSKVLSEMFCPENKLYFIFLRRVFSQVISVNLLFQSDNVDPLQLFVDVNNLLFSFLQIVVVPSHLSKIPRHELINFDFNQYTMPSACCHFGYDFSQASQNVEQEQLVVIKSKCKQFLSDLCNQIQHRLPENFHILQQISVFSPQKSTSLIKEDISQIVSFFKNIVEPEETLKEWQQLATLSLKPDEINNMNTEQFWSHVFKEKDAGGNPRFENIARLVLCLLSLPVSNAVVERAFSIMNVVRDKLRNRLAITTTEAILRLRYSLTKGCNNFQPSNEMLTAFKSDIMYNENFDLEILRSFNDFDKT